MKKEYLAVVRVVSLLLLFGNLIVLGLFYFQNWTIPPFLYVTAAALLAGLVWDNLSGRNNT